jgi:excisionase family DNA binding protein
MPQAPPKNMSFAEAFAQGLPLTEKQISIYLQVSTRQVRRLVAQGLPSYLVGHSRRFDVVAVRTWLSTTLPKLSQQSGGLHPKEHRESRLH